MAEAERLSKEALASGGGPLVAVIGKKRDIIGRVTKLVSPGDDPTAHAEIAARRVACKGLMSFQLEGGVLYTSCEPCPMCLGAIYWARPTAVYFANTKRDAAKIGFDDEFIYEEIGKRHSQRTIPFYRLKRKDAL